MEDVEIYDSYIIIDTKKNEWYYFDTLSETVDGEYIFEWRYQRPPTFLAVPNHIPYWFTSLNFISKLKTKKNKARLYSTNIDDIFVIELSVYNIDDMMAINADVINAILVEGYIYNRETLSDIFWLKKLTFYF